MKPEINFENVAQQLYEEKKLKDFKKNNPDYRDAAFTGFNIAVIFTILITSIVVGSSLAIIITENKANIQKALYWIDSLPWTANLFILLPCLAFVIWWKIHRSAVKSRE